jgi:hypothetical protein
MSLLVPVSWKPEDGRRNEGCDFFPLRQWQGTSIEQPETAQGLTVSTYLPCSAHVFAGLCLDYRMSLESGHKDS